MLIILARDGVVQSKASFNCILRIRKEKNQPTKMLFGHLCTSFPGSGRGSMRPVILGLWMFTKEQEANRVKEDCVAREGSREGWSR